MVFAAAGCRLLALRRPRIPAVTENVAKGNSQCLSELASSVSPADLPCAPGGSLVLLCQNSQKSMEALEDSRLGAKKLLRSALLRRLLPAVAFKNLTGA